MKKLLFKSATTSTLENVRELRRSLTSVLGYCINEEQLQQAILVCLSEALTNLVQHNNSPSLEIIFSQSVHHWHLEIIDKGYVWDPSLVREDNDLNEMTTKEDHRGIALIHTLCKQISYQSDDKSNSLSLSWERASHDDKASILIVDDDASLRRLYSSYLEDDFEVKLADNGFEALDVIKQHHIKLILSDIHMPLMDGLTFKESLAQENKSALIPFIFLTSNDHASMQQRTIDMGIDDYLVKPVDKKMLLQSITRILQRSEQVFHQLTDRIEQQITSSLKPNLPSISHGWKLAVDTRDTGLGGGDFLLHHETNSALTISVADVMGHDDSAKFFSYAYAGYLYGLMNALDVELSPARLLAQLSNHALKDQLFSKVTMTCCIANLYEEGKLSIAAAGHPPPLLITPTSAEYIDVAGILPGLVGEYQYQQADTTLKHCERMAIYTDGLFESAANESSRIELEQQLRTTLLETINLDIDSALSSVMKKFDHLTSNKASDDVMLILIERA